MANFLGFDKNISHFTIPPALVLALLPKFFSGLAGPGAKYLDRNNPRDFSDTLKRANLDDEVRGRLLRAEACSLNGFEALPFYAAAVAAGNAAGVSTAIMNALSILWLGSRLVYIYVYIWYSGTEKLAPGQAPLRFKVWAFGATICMSMFVLAGLKA
ncbi:hypothetical protein C7974DRAFT_394636 [Boeremia exigua]|uniref:uncharacterized protein n=1 Tax=Boeremia exigua TaxID=749465 RepID=UPI001E8DD986|nr:uncharacterized protein C7974DRAFT_394636 [Boeremia exigua]KAH6629508.1 hypothetical protein C7974DRAFT_394636 [Boeremia exigua]